MSPNNVIATAAVLCAFAGSALPLSAEAGAANKTATPPSSELQYEAHIQRDIDKQDQGAAATVRQLMDDRARAALLRQRLLRLTPPERAKAVSKLPVSAVVDVPEYWATVHDPERLMSALRTIGEPMTPSMVAALARMFSKFDTDSGRLHAAALLYRYGVPEGKNYLLAEAAQASGFPALVILVMNHEPQSLQPAMARVRSQGPGSAVLLRLLARWKSPQVAAALGEAFEDDHGNAELALAVGAQSIRSATPALYHEAGTSTDEAVRQACRVAIARLSDDNTSIIQVLQELDPPTASGISLNAARMVAYLNVVDDPRAAPVLERFAEAWLSSPKPSRFDAAQRSSGAVADVAEMLARYRGKDVRDVIERMLRRCAMEDTTRIQTMRVASAYLQAGGTGGTVREVLPPVLAAMAISQIGLKPLPMMFQLGTQPATVERTVVSGD
jgi:hypothetical protein